MRTGVVAAVAALLCVLLLPLGPPAAAAGGQWTAEPAAVGGTRPYAYLEGVPGAVLQDALAVTNPGRAPLAVRLSGSPRTAFARAEVTVPARTRAEVPFAVTVPADAVPGERTEDLRVSAAGREVTVRVRLRVGGTPLAALTVEDVRLAAGRLRYTLVNRGNTTLSPRLEVRADGLFGTVLHRPGRALGRELAPASRTELSEPWDAPALDAVDVTLRVTAGPDVHAEGRTSAVYVPWGPVAAGAAAVLAAGAWLLRRRRAHPGADDELADEERDLVEAGAQ
ncbi:hypothetical protein ABT160_12940 [Streptomyces sp. NPDC001941]|uniref:COG1470 family protein n=1 Tax=Streptomyces sp. NPDC001941 TaxID=3154659 RepID=UPI00332C9C22